MLEDVNNKLNTEQNTWSVQYDKERAGGNKIQFTKWM